MLSVSVRVGPCPGVVSWIDVVPCVEPGSWVDAAAVNGGRFDLARPTSDISPLYNRAQILQQPVLGGAGILSTLSLERPARVKPTAVFFLLLTKQRGSVTLLYTGPSNPASSFLLITSV